MKCRNIYISRHGVRSTQLPDWAPPCTESYNGPEYDRPLAAMGREQAEALARRMDKIPLDHIFSSPFRRTIQSVVPLARAKGLPIKLEWGIEELLKQEWFGTYPELPSPAERQREIPEVDADYESVLYPTFPETPEALLERVDKTLQVITRNYGPNIFLMGHGASANGFCAVLLQDAKKRDTYFCSLSQLSWENGKWHAAIEGDVSHLLERGIHHDSRPE